MSAFSRAKKFIMPGKNKNKTSGSDDFDFDELEGMSDEFNDDHDAGTDRKSSIKSYIKDHYSAKLNDSTERKRLLKSSMPASYSGPIDLASDLKDDLDSMRYELSKEWDKQSGTVKKTIKGFESQLKFLKMNKVVNWANSSSGRSGSYEDDPASQNEAMVASMMGDFLNPAQVNPRDAQLKQKARAKEKEDDAEYRSKTLNTQLRGAVSNEQTVSELRKLTNYQDQITYVYQKKSLEVQIRSYVEHKTQTEILRAYKDESVAELKEIHKNTGLPDAVKINQNELAAQVFKERMLGNVSNWFDGKTAGIRKRVTTRIKDKLLDMTKNFGSSLESFVGMAGADDEQGGGGLAKLLMGMGADAALDKPYGKLTDKLTGKIRNKLMGNTKINKFGKRIGAMTKNAGMLANNALLTGESGSGVIDSLMDFFGMRQAAVTRNTKVRGSLSENLDKAAYMDVKFKQTVERVIPGWLSMIHKETHLIRTGQKDDKNHKAVEWDWHKEDFTSKESKDQRVLAKIFNREKTIDHSEAYERLLHHFDSFSLSAKTKDKLRTWLFKRVRAGASITLYDLLRETNSIFAGSERDEICIMTSVQGGLDMADIEGVMQGAKLEWHLTQRDSYANWLNGLTPLYHEVAGKELIDWKQVQQLAEQGETKILEENGLVTRDSAGNININTDYEEEHFKTQARFKHKQTKFYKEDGDRKVKGQDGRTESRAKYEIDEARSAADWEDRQGDELTLENNEANRQMNRWVTSDVLDEREAERQKNLGKSKAGKHHLMTIEEAKKRGLLDSFTRAAGGYIPTFAKGGPTGDDKAVDEEIHAKLHGKEFVTDKETTEKNRKLLEFMNKFKAPVVMPDGSVNPIYYKAFGYKTESDFKDSDTDTKLTREQTRFFKGIKNAGSNDAAYGLVADLFTSLDLTTIPEKELDKLVSNKVSTAEKFKIFLELRKKQAGSKKKSKAKQDLLGGGITKLRHFVDGTGPKNEKLENLKGSASKLFESAKKEISSMSEEQLDTFVNKALGTLDDGTLTEAQLETLTDPSVPAKTKALMIAKLTMSRKDKAAQAKKAVSAGLKSAKDAAKSKIKNAINGGADDTTNTDNLKAIADKGKDYVKGKVGGIKGLAESGKLDETAKALGNKAIDKLRLGRAAELGKKFWKDAAIDIYIANYPESPRLTAVGFTEGLYIDKESGRVLATHHDITGPVTDSKGEYLLQMPDFEKGLVDKEGTPIFINSLKRYRNMAKEKATALYNKYGKKYVNKGTDALLSMTENWQAMFKKTDIDIYVGGGVEPRLTATGFREGKYISVLKKKPLKGYMDIDGPVMLADGTMVITTDEISNSVMTDKDGNAIRPPKLMSNMERLGSLVWKALSFDKAYNGGKKALGKLKDRWKAWKEKNKKPEEGAEGEEEQSGTKPASRWGSKLKDKLKRFGGVDEDEDGGKTLRVGSWQWKRKKKEESSWMSKFSGLFGAKKEKEGEKKSGILGKLLGAVVGIGGAIFGGVNKLMGGITGGLWKVAKWVVPSIGGTIFKTVSWLAKPLLTSLAFIGKKIGGAAMGGGMGIGKMAKIGGLAAGGYMAYQGLKGKEKLDENGQPILGADGKPETETDWGQAAMGAGTMALSTGVGLKAAGSMLMGAGTAVRVAAGILSGPVGWATLGATAAYFGTKWAVGAWKKGKAAKDSPLLSFRINQYGFDMTDETVMGKLMQLESTLQPNLEIQGEKATFKADMDVESVFTIFGLKYEGGDQEKNKKFLTWFLGRFKPVYLAYVRAMNAIKKKTDITNIDKDLTATQAIELLDKVHFKNQMDLNPYNIKVSPFDDPDETDYDFEDIQDKYDDIKEILGEKAKTETAATPAGAKGAEGEKKPEEKEATLGESMLKGAKIGGVAGGIVGGSIWALKKLGAGAGDIFNKTTEGLGKATTGFMDNVMGKVAGAMEKIKSLGASVADGATAVVDGAKDIGSGIASGAGRAAEWIGNIGSGGETEATLTETAKKAGVTDPEELAMLLAQASHESGGFKYAKEIGKDSYFAKYDNRKDLGNGPGDGARYKGRGWIQITGKANYAAFSKWAGIDAVSKPEMLEKEPYSSLATIWFWTQHSNMTRMGRKAAQDGNVEKATKAVNGGQNGLADRKQRYTKYIAMIKNGELGQGGGGASGGGGGTVGAPAQSTGVMAGDSKTGGAAAAGSGAPAGVKSQAAGIVGSANTTAKGGSSPGGGVLKPGAPAGSAKSVPGAVGTKSTATPTGGLATLLAKCTPELVNLGKSHYSLNTGGKSKVTLEGMNGQFMQLFYAMIGEAKQKGLGKILITEGVRTLAEQQRLYNLYKAGQGALAAVPGKSLHGFGHAMDINTPNADALDKAGLLAKYGFSRPLMKTVKGKRTEQWHIENKSVPRNGVTPSYPKMNTPVTVTSSSPSTQNVSYQSKDGTVTNGSGGSSSPGISSVMNSGGYNGTSGVSTAQQSDMSGLTTTNSILNKQLSVQTEIKNTLVEIKNYFVKPAGDPAELEQLKKRNSPENIGSMIGGSVAEALAGKLGLNKAAEKPKPSAVISAKK